MRSLPPPPPLLFQCPTRATTTRVSKDKQERGSACMHQKATRASQNLFHLIRLWTNWRATTSSQRVALRLERYEVGPPPLTDGESKMTSDTICSSLSGFVRLL